MGSKIWFNKSNTFQEAREFDTADYLGLSSAEGLETIQILREADFNAAGLLTNENRKRLRSVFRVIKQA